MNPRSRLLVGAALLVLGTGTLWLAATQSEDDVRYVEDLLVAPAAHREGEYTLMGVPEPAQVPVLSGLVANPRYSDETRGTVQWQAPDGVRYSTHILRVAAQSDGSLLWRFANETRTRPDLEPIALSTQNWTLGRAGEAFPVVAFTEDGIVRPDTPRIWALYGKAPEHPMQPKPSQFGGRLMTSLPDGTPLPDGALVYDVSAFTAGCSSKFLPPAAQEQYEKDAAALERPQPL